MTTVGKISRDSFKKMVSGGKGYLPSKITKQLKDAGMSSLLHNDSISKQKAIKAIKHLQESGDLSKYKSANTMWHETATEQYDQDQLAIEEEQQQNIQTRMRMDLSEDTISVERGENPYDPKSSLGQSVADEIAKEQQERAEASDKELQRKKGHDQQKKVGKTRPGTFDPKQVKDMIID